MRRFLITVMLFAAVAAARAGTQPAPPGPRPDCRGPEFRQFDFWIGEWTVTEKGAPAGANRIESALAGCALVEHWSSAHGGHGMSLNCYDRTTRAWYQNWTDEQGGALRLKGGLVDGRMQMQTEPVPGDRSVQRVTWTPNADATVRQHWESSVDGGAHWTTVFDGVYARVK